MSGSTKRGEYNALPVNTLQALQVSEREISFASTEEKSEYPRQESGYLLWHWRWEIFTFLLGTGAFITILALLLRFRNKPPPDILLGNNNIQLTAIIAALAQVAQSALLVPISYCIGQLKWSWFQRSKRIVDLDRFDLASRGPDGSIRLLLHFSWRQRLVSLGALATVLMLLFPTFVQQSVHVGDKDIIEHNSDLAYIPHAKNVFKITNTRIMISTDTNNSTIFSYQLDTDFNKDLQAGASGYKIPGHTFTRGNSEINGNCGGPAFSNCSWPSFNSLGLCYSTSNITDQIILHGDYVSLPALKPFLKQGEDPPTFQSGTYLYVAEGQTAATSLPTTSASDGTNLRSLAEVYYLFYDVCHHRGSQFNKKDPKRWQAHKIQFQFCIHNLTSQKFDNGLSETFQDGSETRLDWYKTTKYNESAFCTKVDSEPDDFCVGESLMESLSHQMSYIFNATVYFSDENRTDLRYSSEWGPRLTPDIFGLDLQICSFETGHPYNYMGMNPDPFEGPSGNLSGPDGIARSLSNAFPYNDPERSEVRGTHKHRITLLLVDFRWLILPAVLYAIIAVFFAATIISTRNTPMWKSSPLALLHAMKEDGDIGNEDKIRKEAKKSRVRLVPVGTGWQLIEDMEPRKRGS